MSTSTHEIRFDIAELKTCIELRFDRSAGPGGQNVNKVNTRVTLYFDFENCTQIDPEQRRRIRDRLATRLSRDGRVRVVSRRARTQAMNRTFAEQRLIELLEQALHVPKTRKKTRPSAASRRKRAQDKRRQSEKKRMRRRVSGHDE